MRNLKKILAAITVIAMLASMMVVPALAEGFKYEEEATILNELKLMEGMGLGDSVNRLQGLIFAIKAAGLKDEVDAMTDEEAAAILAEKVVDADEVPAWGVKWTAYAVEKGFTSGVDASVAPKVKFAPLQEVSATSFLVWIMNIGMGYKYGTDVVVAEAVNANVISLSQAMEIGAKAAIIRDDAAGILYGACKNGVNADGKTFIQSLIDAGVVTEEAAIAAGLVEAKPEVLEVVGVSATNLKQLVVEFNMPIKKAGDKDNYSIETEDAQAKIDEETNFELQDDKKTVVITLTNAAAQQEVIDLKIKGIESESGLKLDETVIKDIELKDTTIPQAISAEVVGKYTIKVKFSEPICEPSADDKDFDDFFSVDDGEYLIEKIEKFNNDTELNVTLYSALEEGTVTIEAKPAIKDYAKFGITKKTFTLDVVEDETGPVVVDYKDAKPNKVTLVFDEDVELLANPVNKDNKNFWPDFYHTNENNVADDVKVEGKEVTLTFTTNALPEGRAYIYIKKDALQDLWENKNAKISYVVEVTLDTEPPVIEKIEQDGESAIKVTFSEDLDDDTAENVENYTILKDGKEVEDIISGAFLIDTEDKVVKITFNDDLSGDYTLVAQKVEDKAGNAMSKTTVAFTMKDTDPPKVTGAKLYYADNAKKQTLKVTFSEAMAVSGAYSVLDLDKYALSIGREKIFLDEWKNASIKAVDNKKAVEIKLPYDEKDKEDSKQFALLDEVTEVTVNEEDSTLEGLTLEIARVADAAGNKMKEFKFEVLEIGKAGYVKIDKVELTAEDTVVVTFKDKLTKFKTTDFYRKSDSTIESALTSGDSIKVSIEIARIRHSVNKDGNSEVVLTIAKDYRTTALGEGEWKFKPLTVTKDGETFAESANTYGETIETNEKPVEDKAAPVVKEVYFVDLDDSSLNDDNTYKGKDMILVVFSEAIHDKTVRSDKKVSGFSVSGNKAELSEAYLLGGKITVKVGTEDKEIDANTAVVLIGKNFNKYVDVSYDDAFGMADLNGNKVKSFSRKDTLKVVADTVYTPWSDN